MEEWKSYRLGDIVRIGSGLAYKADYLGSGDALLLGMGCVSFTEKFLKKGARPYSGVSEERYFVSPGDIVLATRQQSDNLPILGMPAIIPNDYIGTRLIAGSNLYIVHNQSEIDNRFLFWLLKTPEYINHISSCKTGTTVRMITKKDVESFVFKCPPKDERERIANFLWTIEEKIDLNNRINHNLEEQAQALYKSWFVDFEPFKDGKFVDSELGLIPAGWSVKSLGEVTKEIRDKVSARQDVKVLSPVTSGRLVLSEEFFTKQVFSESIAKYLLVKPGDFAYNPARVNIGSLGLNEYPFDGCVSPVYVVFRCESGYNHFFDLYRTTAPFKDEVLSRSSGGVRQTLAYKDFALIRIVYPPRVVIESFNSLYEGLIAVQKSNLKENEILSSQRDSLLPLLMSGQVLCVDLNC